MISLVKFARNVWEPDIMMVPMFFFVKCTVDDVVICS